MKYKRYIAIEPENIGKALKAARKRKGLTQVELARRSGFDASTISKIETGSSKTPDINTLWKLEVVLGEPLFIGIKSSGNEVSTSWNLFLDMLTHIDVGDYIVTVEPLDGDNADLALLTFEHPSGPDARKMIAVSWDDLHRLYDSTCDFLQFKLAEWLRKADNGEED